MSTAVIVDMDGTLVNVDSIAHHLAEGTRDFDRFHRESEFCPANQQALDFCHEARADGHAVIIVTARAYRFEAVTRRWLAKHFEDQVLREFHGPFMRGDRDFRADTEVKRDIHRILTEDHGLQIVRAIDDNPPIVELWESLGVPTTVVPRAWKGTS